MLVAGMFLIRLFQQQLFHLLRNIIQIERDDSPAVPLFLHLQAAQDAQGKGNPGEESLDPATFSCAMVVAEQLAKQTMAVPAVARRAELGDAFPLYPSAVKVQFAGDLCCGLTGGIFPELVPQGKQLLLVLAHLRGQDSSNVFLAPHGSRDIIQQFDLVHTVTSVDL